MPIFFHLTCVRNLSLIKRLCNSTKLIVKNLKQYIIEAEIITGTHLGQRVYIPWFKIVPLDADLPFQLIHHQFPTNIFSIYNEN